MTVFSALNTQSLAASNQVEIETRSQAEIAAEDAEKQKTDFLKLLLTQLEAQNPLDPMDTDEYTAQLTRYSILEQGIETNANLSITNDHLQTNVANTSLSYVGETIEASSNWAPVQEGNAYWSYEILDDVDEVTLTFLDENGDQVHEMPGSTLPGVQNIALNAGSYGLTNGAPVEIVIAARDENGGAISSRVTSYAQIDGVWNNGDKNYLTSGGVSYRPDDILKISELNLAQNTQETTP